jgi:hypothetical protein
VKLISDFISERMGPERGKGGIGENLWLDAVDPNQRIKQTSTVFDSQLEHGIIAEVEICN